MKILIKKIIANLSVFSGFLCLYKWISGKNKVTILMYHKIANDKEIIEKNISVKKTEFEKQIKYISKNYNIINFRELDAILKKEKKLPKNSLIISFDDGYKDNYTNAYPILKKYNLPATIFLTTSNLNKKGFLSEKEIIDMQMIDIGTHTVSHPHLTNIDEKGIKREIKNSKVIIEKNFKNKINVFSYPYGTVNDFNDNIKKIIKENGFFCAVTSLIGVNNINNSDLFELRRIRVNIDDNLNLFKFNLLGLI